MAKYKCPTIGDCSKATVNELFEKELGEDLHCPECSTLLVAVNSGTEKGYGSTGGSGGFKLPFVVGGAVALLAIAGGGFYFFSHSKSEAINTLAPISSESAPTLASSAPVSMAASSLAPQLSANSMAPSDEVIKQEKRDSEEALIKGEAKTAEAASNRAAAKELLKIGIAQMTQNKLEEAEKTFRDAESKDPKESLVYYNMAVLRLKQNRVDDALKEFESSFLNGFKYYDEMNKDVDLNALRKDKRFVDLVNRYHHL